MLHMLTTDVLRLGLVEMERKSAREESGMPRQRGGLIRCTGRSSDLASGNGSTGGLNSDSD